MIVKCSKLDVKKQCNSRAQWPNNSLPADKAGDKVAHFMLRVWVGGGGGELTPHKLFSCVWGRSQELSQVQDLNKAVLVYRCEHGYV